MRMMGDGSVIPANFNTTPMPDAKAFLGNNLSLRAGAVIGIHYPDQEANISKQVIEYDVAIFQADHRGGVNISTMRNCKVNNMFGAPNNNSTYTLVPGTKDGDGVYQKSSIVTVLCVNGMSDVGGAVIVGGLSSPDGPKYTSEDGQFYDFNFNGINYNINKDGEWTVTFNSPIDVDGKKKNEAAAGTIVKIDKEGRVKISDNEGQFWQIDRVAKTSTWSNGAESIVIDKGSKSVSLTSSGEMSSKSEKAMSMASSDAVNMSSKSDTAIDSGANLNMSSKSNMQQTSGAAWQVKATGDVMVQAGGNLMMQGGNIAQMQGTLNLIGAGTSPVAVVGLSQVLSFLGPIPIPGQILTGSATVFVGT